MKANKANLYFVDSAGLLVPRKTGFIFEHEVGGAIRKAVRCEGIFLPVPFWQDVESIDKIIAPHNFSSWHMAGKAMDSESMGRINSPFKQSSNEYLSKMQLDTSNMHDSYLFWMHVLFNEPIRLLSNCETRKAILVTP